MCYLGSFARTNINKLGNGLSIVSHTEFELNH